jgi:phosphatidylserine decarboxylase
MTGSETDLSHRRYPWFRSGFDLEGWLGAVAAWLVGILLGIIWGPLFWVGLAAAILILMATRTSERTPPSDVDLIVTPTDGTLVSITATLPPEELRLDGDDWTRLRISLGPTTSNGLYAPIDGAVDHLINEPGDTAAIAATKPDLPGMAVAYVGFASEARKVGMRLATGGLGPRLEINAEPGDAVRVGRQFGILRLGGWCDLYLPGSVKVRAWPGQTLVGAETILGSFAETATGVRRKSETEATPEPADPEERTGSDDAAEAEAGPAEAKEEVAETSKPAAETRATPKRTNKPRSTSKKKPTPRKTTTRKKPAAKKADPEPSDKSATDQTGADGEDEDVSSVAARLRKTAGDEDSET